MNSGVWFRRVYLRRLFFFVTKVFLLTRLLCIKVLFIYMSFVVLKEVQLVSEDGSLYIESLLYSTGVQILNVSFTRNHRFF